MSALSDLELKLTQMFMVGIPGVELNDETEKFLNEHNPIGTGI